MEWAASVDLKYIYLFLIHWKSGNSLNMYNINDNENKICSEVKMFLKKEQRLHTELECSFFQKPVLKKGYEAATKNLMKESSFLDKRRLQK